MKKITNGQGNGKISRGSERKGKVHDNLDLVNGMIKDGLSDTYIRYHLTAEAVGRKKHSYRDISQYAMKEEHTPHRSSLR
jgi:hypothetical protein